MQTWRYSCRAAERNNTDLSARQWVEVKPMAAYCPLCGFALADFWHARFKRDDDPPIPEEFLSGG